MTLVETVGWILITLGLAVTGYCVLWAVAAIRDAARAADEATAEILGNASLAREYPCGHRHASAELAQRCPNLGRASERS